MDRLKGRVILISGGARGPGNRLERFGTGQHEQPGGHDHPLPEPAEFLQRMYRQHVDALTRVLAADPDLPSRAADRDIYRTPPCYFALVKRI
jgi:hypothetical protein